MLKEERWEAIVDLVDREGTVKVADIMEQLAVSDMTVRRDLSELDKKGILKKIHGGAQSIHHYKRHELSHGEKKIIHMAEKQQVVKKALGMIEEGDTIFLGPGTTLELLAEKLTYKNLRVITNSLPVFETLMEKDSEIEVYLLGGQIRKRTKAFFGSIGNQALSTINFQKTFVSCNAIKNNEIMTATIEEGLTQQIALDRAVEKYLLADASKINKEDFYTFYKLSDFNCIFTNDDELHSYQELENYVTTVI